MSLRNAHRYVAELTARDGRPLARLPLEPDFVPAAESAHLAAVRAGALPASAHHGPGVVEPVYEEPPGAPWVRGLRVRFDAERPGHDAPLIPWRYLQGAVEQAARQLVTGGTLAAGESFVYRICAFAQAAVARPAPGEADAPPVLSLERAAVEALAAGAERLGEAAWDERDFPVFVHRSVLDDATRMARAAGERECGGILVGHLRHDRDTPDIHIEITAQIPATQARAGRASLGFTPETWSAMSDALALRARAERMLGWWHAHPHFCARCAPDQRARCALSQPFFSRDDCELHRTVFDAAFNVALLLSDTGGESLSYDLFGWRLGSIAARGGYLLPVPGRTCAPAPAQPPRAHPARILDLRERP